MIKVNSTHKGHLSTNEKTQKKKMAEEKHVSLEQVENTRYKFF
jgi:hypothetical protein